jgi:signal-transduction protein with cAMP-binding, CBS, and nucleotidyltransferase domain
MLATVARVERPDFALKAGSARSACDQRRHKRNVRPLVADPSLTDDDGMNVGDVVTRPPVTLPPEATLRHAAQVMAAEGVGSLIIVDHGRVAGIVTDRDMVVRAMARGYEPDARIDSVMSTDVVAVDATTELLNAIRAFDHHAVRRLPVVHNEQIVGVLSVDQVVVSLVTQLAETTHGLAGQLIFPRRAEPSPPAVATP